MKGRVKFVKQPQCVTIHALHIPHRVQLNETIKQQIYDLVCFFFAKIINTLCIHHIYLFFLKTQYINTYIYIIMWFRWCVVFILLLWIVYECTKPFWTVTLPTIWTSYNTYIKVGVGVFAILLVVSLPSLETVARQDNQIYSMMREFLVDDKYLHHFEQPRHSVQTNEHRYGGYGILPSPSPSYSLHTGKIGHMRNTNNIPFQIPSRTASSPFEHDMVARAKFRDGVKLARGDANLPD